MYSFYESDIEDFWFEEGEDNYKNKWFQKDKDKLVELDRIITQKFKDKLELYESYAENKWEYGWGGFCGVKQANEMIDAIICLDQFSRHIYRLSKNIEKIRNNTKKASIYSKVLLGFIEDKFIEEQDITLPREVIVFILMPLKHDDIYKNFKRINNFIESTYGSFPYSSKLISKFYLDSIKKYSIDSKHTLDVRLFDFSNNGITYTFNTDYQEVCEYYPPQKIDMAMNYNDNSLYKLINTFLTNLHNNKLSVRFNYKRRIIVSLSGGPDSMVVLFLLCILSKKHSINIEAFHINYKNRSESYIEEDMIKHYCEKLGIKLHIYTFEYLRRKKCDRELYENLTRKVRFNIYKYLDAPVILGHIKDDLIENIWTNLSKGKELFKLHKIEESSYIDEQPILRPFHRTEKKDIIQFAKEYNIPYLKNTTPDWSNRGKLRNNFIPEVNKQFGNIDNKLLYMSDSISSYYTILDKMLFKPFLESIKYHKYGLLVSIKDMVSMPHHFWQEMLTKMLHSLNSSSPSIKSINNFTDAINRNKKGLIIIKKNYVAFIDNDLSLHILNLVMIQDFTGKSKLMYNDWIYIIKCINTYI